MVNPWVIHLVAFRKANPNLSMKEAMQAAKKTYKKVSGPSNVTKKSKKSRKSRKSKKSLKSKKSRKSRKSRK